MGRFYIRYGVVIAILLAAYFLISWAVGLHKYPIFSALNGVIFGWGILMAMKKYKASTDFFAYQDGFQVGLFTGGIATFLFAAFMAIFIFYIDAEFTQNILDSWDLNYNKGSLIIVVSLIMMGLSTTFVLTLAFMQLLKDSWNTAKKS